MRATVLFSLTFPIKFTVIFFFLLLFVFQLMIIFFNFFHSWSFAVIRGHSWSFVIIHGYSWSLVCTFRHDSQSRVKAVENIPCNNPI